MAYQFGTSWSYFCRSRAAHRLKLRVRSVLAKPTIVRRAESHEDLRTPLLHQILDGMKCTVYFTDRVVVRQPDAHNAVVLIEAQGPRRFVCIVVT